MSLRLNRRQWALGLAAAPALAQTTTSVPPLGSPSPAPLSASPAAKMTKALQDVQSNSQRLASIGVAMNVEPAFQFKV